MGRAAVGAAEVARGLIARPGCAPNWRPTLPGIPAGVCVGCTAGRTMGRAAPSACGETSRVLRETGSELAIADAGTTVVTWRLT